VPLPVDGFGHNAVVHHPATVRSREDLVQFVAALRVDLERNVESWENPSLDRYLDALSAWINDMPGWFQNRGEAEAAQPDWSLVAQMLYAATIYE
jgi:hypothetical protein